MSTEPDLLTILREALELLDGAVTRMTEQKVSYSYAKRIDEFLKKHEALR